MSTGCNLISPGRRKTSPCVRKLWTRAGNVNRYLPNNLIMNEMLYTGLYRHLTASIVLSFTSDICVFKFASFFFNLSSTKEIFGFIWCLRITVIPTVCYMINIKMHWNSRMVGYSTLYLQGIMYTLGGIFRAINIWSTESFNVPMIKKLMWFMLQKIVYNSWDTYCIAALISYWGAKYIIENITW